MEQAHNVPINQLNPEFNARLAMLIDANMPTIFPALSLCVMYKGDLVLKGAWGWIDPDTHEQPVTVDSLFDLASVTKLFVETTFLSLVSEGQISLDSKLVDVIPEFGKINPRPIDGGQDPHSKEYLTIDEDLQGKTVDPTEVTFQHLMTHTSGLPPWRDVYNAAGEPPTPPTEPDPISQSQRWQNAQKALYQYPFVGTVGDTVRYSDIGLMLLGEAISRLHGNSLDKAVAWRVLKKLNLLSVTYNPVRKGIPIRQTVPTENDPTWRKRRAWGEVHDENACGVGGIAGHAGLFATAHDVAQFGQAWLSRDERLAIKGELMDRAVTQHASGQFRLGLGWMLKAAEASMAGDLYSPSSYGHSGFTGTTLWIDPERELVTAVLTNRVYPGREQEGIYEFRRAIHDLIAQGVDAL